MANLIKANKISNYLEGKTYIFMYNDKLREARVERVLNANARNKSPYLHCTVIAEDGVACPVDTFKNFTIANIQG